VPPAVDLAVAEGNFSTLELYWIILYFALADQVMSHAVLKVQYYLAA